MGTQDKSVQLKLSLLKLAGEIGNVSKACAMMNFSRDSYYRFRSQYRRGGEEALKNVNRKKPLLKNRVSNNIETAVCDFALAHPETGQQKAAALLQAKNITVSPSGVRSIWIRHDLETRAKRAQAIRAKVLQDGLAPSKEQQTLLRATTKGGKTKPLEDGGPGFLCFHVQKPLGEINGIGQVFLQIFQDTYSRYTLIRLDTDKGSHAASSFLAERVLPWFQSHQTPLQKISSDRARAFGGHHHSNDYQKLLAERDIEHSFRATRASAPDEPWVNFFQIIKDEFFRFAIPSRTNWTLSTLQQAADEWLSFYNSGRPNSYRFCYGKTPLDTFTTARSGILRSANGEEELARVRQRANG